MPKAMQWVDGPDKTGSNGVGDEDLGVKPSEYESGVIKMGSTDRRVGAGAGGAAGITRT